jgi:type II secretory pathway pseudopilin PulG
MFVIFGTIIPRRRAPSAPPAPLLAATRDGHRRPHTAKRIRSRLSEEDGFTLIEMLVAAAAAIVVFGAVLAMLESSQQVEARDTEWALTLQEDRAGLARMARDIRQATKVEEAKSSAIVFLAAISGKSWKIKYECNVSQSGTTYTQCIRLAAEEGKILPGTGPAVVKDIVNGTAVFSYFKGAESNAVAPNGVTLKIELPAKGTLKQAGNSGYSHNVVLENAAFMRNLYLEG